MKYEYYKRIELLRRADSCMFTNHRGAREICGEYGDQYAIGRLARTEKRANRKTQEDNHPKSLPLQRDYTGACNSKKKAARILTETFAIKISRGCLSLLHYTAENRKPGMDKLFWYPNDRTKTGAKR